MELKKELNKAKYNLTTSEVDAILLLFKKREEAMIKGIEEYLEIHKRDTKPWITITGKEMKRIIEEDIVEIIKEGSK